MKHITKDPTRRLAKPKLRSLLSWVLEAMREDTRDGIAYNRDDVGTPPIVWGDI